MIRSAARDLARLWRPLAGADLLYKALAFILLTPLTTAVLRLQVARAGPGVVADADILRFLVTTRLGIVALLLVSALAVGIYTAGLGCLMTLSLCATRSAPVRIRDAFAFVLARGRPILHLALRIVVRVIALVAPFLLAIGLVYKGLLGAHDINFYLQQKPPVFWLAAALAAGLVAAGAALLLPRLAGWLVALPLLLFERVPPGRCLRASQERMTGRRAAATWALAGWALPGVVLPPIVAAVFAGFARLIAPALATSLPLLLLAVSVLLLCWAGVLLVVAVLSSSFLALLAVQLHQRTGAPASLDLPTPPAGRTELGAGRWRPSRGMLAGGTVVAVALATAAAYLMLHNAWADRPVLVIAHRGAAGSAPENTLASFHRAIADGADMVELDVQESADGEVLVVHDLDLMKIGRSPLRVCETPAARLREVDVGSHFSAEFHGERVPTLAEALALCKGKVRVNIELKSYGHAQRLEERVVALVEAAGMERNIVSMSMNHDMVRTMERLRPDWTAGILAAKAIGDLIGQPGDFLAVHSKMATPRFIRQAHRAGKPVYVWTLNDTGGMLSAMAAGADGLITDQPAIARRLVHEHAALDPPQRLLLALLARLGGSTEPAVPDNELRP